MPDILLYNRRGSKTAKLLAKELGMRAVRDDRMAGTFTNPPKIRWGTSVPTHGDVTTINSRVSIATSAHGRTMLRTLDSAGIHTPHPFPFESIINNNVPEAEFWLARKNNHRGGTDIRVCRTRDDFLSADLDNYAFFVAYVPTSIELRVHVFGGQVLKAFKKFHANPNASFIRSSYHGWQFKRVSIEDNYPKAIPVAIAATEALGLTFGAVDMAWDITTRQWIIWEVNSAPSLNAETLKLYVDKFKEIL